MTGSDSEDEDGGCQLAKTVTKMMIKCSENFLLTMENRNVELQSKYEALKRGKHFVYT